MADIAAVSRRLNSSKVVAMRGISANAARAPGRAGGWAALKALEAVTRPHAAGRGASAVSRVRRGASAAPHSPAALTRAATRGRATAGPSTIRSNLSGVTVERPLANPACPGAIAATRTAATALVAVVPAIARQGSSTRHPNDCGLVRCHNQVSCEAAILLAQGTV